MPTDIHAAADDWSLPLHCQQLRKCSGFGGTELPQIVFCDGEAFHSALVAAAKAYLSAPVAVPVQKLRAFIKWIDTAVNFSRDDVLSELEKLITEAEEQPNGQ